MCLKSVLSRKCLISFDSVSILSQITPKTGKTMLYNLEMNDDVLPRFLEYRTRDLQIETERAQRLSEQATDRLNKIRKVHRELTEAIEHHRKLRQESKMLTSREN